MTGTAKSGARRAAWVLAGLLACPADAAAAPTEEIITAPVPAPRLERPPKGGYEPGADRPSSLGLRRLEDGSYAYVDPAQQFTLTILPDGRVRFADRWRRPSAEDSQNGVRGGRPPEGVMAALNPFAGIKMAGPLEWMLRRHGHDLATSAKVEVLERTEAFRTKMAIAWTRDNLARRLRALPTDLDKLWSDESIPIPRRRTILFEHWDACEEQLGINTEGIPTAAVVVVDQERVAAAKKARAAILRFIVRHLGPNSSRAYPDAELRRLNARRASVEPFAPYGSSED